MEPLESRKSSAEEAPKESEQKITLDENLNINKKKKIKKMMMKKKKRTSYLPKIGCLRTDYDYPTLEKSDERGNLDMESAINGGDRPPPTHLVVMVNGLIGSADNWRFSAKQFVKRYPEDVLVHRSKSNTSTLTFDGVDVMGERLVDEVLTVIKRRPGLQKISFVGHSLGGLVARYAIGRLYEKNFTRESSQGNGESKVDGSENTCREKKLKGKIAGLEPINFITIATPHLGSRGHKQVPVFFGLHSLENAAYNLSWLLGRTGKHLFLADSNNGKPPLLLQMVNDCGDLRFMSALQSFRRRVAYANVQNDHMVGWSTSSIRRHNELPKQQQFSKYENYPHVVNVETPKNVGSSQEVLMETKSSGQKRSEMEEVMIRGLTKLSWERVDVSFKKSKQRFFAHNTIQVKSYCINSDGADVIHHMIDNFLL